MVKSGHTIVSLINMTDPNDEDDYLKGPALTPEGRLEKRLESMESRGPLPQAPEKFELVERKPVVTEPVTSSFRDEPAPSPRSDAHVLKWLLAISVLTFIAGAAFLILRPRGTDAVRETSALDQLLSREKPTLLINSTPTGATIIIGGNVVGETPWAGENQWEGQTSLILLKSGYKPWDGRLEGSQQLTFDIRLKK